MIFWLKLRMGPKYAFNRNFDRQSTNYLLCVILKLLPSRHGNIQCEKMWYKLLQDSNYVCDDHSAVRQYQGYGDEMSTAWLGSNCIALKCALISKTWPTVSLLQNTFLRSPRELYKWDQTEKSGGKSVQTKVSNFQYHLPFCCALERIFASELATEGEMKFDLCWI
jgi:hypothetical protein